MPIAQVGSATTGTYGSPSGFTPTFPTGWIPGDVIYISQADKNGGALTGAGGWSVPAVLDAGGPSGAIFRRVMQAGDTPPTVPGLNKGVWACLALRGVDPLTPEDTTQNAQNYFTLDTTIDCPGVTVVTSGAWLLNLFCSATAGITYTPPTGETEYADLANAASMECNLEGPQVPGPTGIRTATLSGSTSTRVAMMFAVRPMGSAQSLVVCQAVSRASVW